MRILDLGGTMCEPPKGTVSFSLDGSSVDDDYNPETGLLDDSPYVCKVIGTYRTMPFPDNTFDAASGDCFLEGSDEDGFEGVIH